MDSYPKNVIRRVTFSDKFMIEKFPNRIVFSADINRDDKGLYRFISRSKLMFAFVNFSDERRYI